MRKTESFCGAVAAAGVMAIIVGFLPREAAAVTIFDITPNTADRAIDTTGGAIYVGQHEARTSDASAYIIPFALPVLQPGESISDASLAFNIIGGNNWRALNQKGLNVYGVRSSTSPTVQPVTNPGVDDGDFTPTATLIQKYVIFETESLNQGQPGIIGEQQTDPAGDAALATWLMTIYQAPAYDPNQTTYAFLRINSTDDITSGRYWALATVNNGDASKHPVLSLTVIPEPTTLTLLAATTLLLTPHRRRRRPRPRIP